MKIGNLKGGNVKIGNVKIGILGGGQLARMLVLRGHTMGFKMYVLSQNKKDPAAEVTQNWIQGDPLKIQALKKFFSLVDLVTFENEFLDTKLIERLNQKFKLSILPKPSLMGRLQDRLEQKKLLIQSKLPTLPMTLLRGSKEAKAFFQGLTSQDIVLKKRRSGYDGYGTFVFSAQKQRQSGFFKTLDRLFKNTKEGFIAEEKISFQRELAFSVARNRLGQVIFLPLVETYQKDACCVWVRGPIEQKNFLNLKKKVRSFLNQIRYEGLMAFELFEKDSKLLINEIAPRVHNSAHYSQTALFEDQFCLHLKSILNEKLKTPKVLSPGFAMLNLLGTQKKKMGLKLFPHLQLHWYGKTQNRKGRKMGHVNALGRNPRQALNTLLKLKNQFQL